MNTQLLQDFPELSHLPREDLEDMLADPMYFQAVFYSLPRVKALYQAQRELGMANESLANKNLALQQDLYKLRSDTKNAFDEAKSLEARWKDLEREQREIYQRLTPQFLLMRLRHATTAQDELSETLASAFIASSPGHDAAGVPNASGTPNGRDVEEFVRDFKELRKVYHKRMMWADRWTSGQVVWRDD